MGSLVQEMLEDLHLKREAIKGGIVGAPAAEHSRMLGELRRLDGILDDPDTVDDTTPLVTGDPLVDEWERQIAEGKMPDLTQGMAKPKPAPTVGAVPASKSELDFIRRKRGPRG